MTERSQSSTGPRRGRFARLLSGSAQSLIALIALGTGSMIVIGQMGDGQLPSLCSPWAFQCFVLAALALVGAILLRAWSLCAASTVALLAAAAVAWPNSPAPNATIRNAGASPVLRVVMANVNARMAPSPEQLEWLCTTPADIIAIVECNHEWFMAVAQARGQTMHHVERPQSDPGGIALFSRFPFRSKSVQNTPADGFPYIDAIVEHPSGPIRVVSVHPLPPVGQNLTRARNEEIDWFAQLCAAESGPLIVVGDFNETMYGPVYKRFVAESRLHDARDGFGRLPSWPAMMWGVRVPSLLRIPIDQCFVSHHFGVQSFSIGTEGTSDHAPIDVSLVRLPGS